MKSERGQSAVLAGLLLIFVVGAVFMVLVGLPGMKQGADTIGETVAEGVENALDPTVEQEWRNIDWQMQHGTLVYFWVNQQRFSPNKHSLARHGGDAWASTNCYNDHGAFMSLANKALDFYLPCREEDGKTVRLTIWKRESATSNRFHMIDAYTPKDGIWSRIEFWLRNTHKAHPASFPPDAVFVIDGFIP